MNIKHKHLWLFARIELGISREEFKSMDMADWHAALEIWSNKLQREARREDELVARLSFWINISVVPRKKTDKLPKLSDFLPVYSKMKQKKTRKPAGKALWQKIQQTLS